jgi:hypothetical protein
MLYYYHVATILDQLNLKQILGLKHINFTHSYLLQFYFYI